MKNFVSNILKKMGYTIVKTSNFHKIQTREVKIIDNYESLVTIFYNNLRSSNFNPQFIIDVGANVGNWSRKFLETFPNTKVLMIEPQERLKHNFQDLLNDKVEYLPVGVGNKNDILKFTIHDRDDSCSFVFSEDEAKQQGFEQIEVPIKTINAIINENNYPIPDLIKIDAEGLDLEVIEGASNIFGKTEVILVEATVACPTYKNTAAKVIKMMDERGYQMYEITDLNRPFRETQILWLIEMAFVKKDSILLQNNITV